MPVFPQPSFRTEAQKAEDEQDDIEDDSPTPPALNQADSSLQRENTGQEIAREPLRLTLSTSKPTSNIVMMARTATNYLSSLGSRALNTLGSAVGVGGASSSPSTTLAQASVSYPGIYNMGHTCYVNSCVQALMFTPQFRDALLRTDTTLSSLDYSEPHPQKSPFDNYTIFVEEFSELLRELFAKKQNSTHNMLATSARPTKYLSSLNALDDRYGSHSEQQDVQEFLVFLLSTLDDGAKMTQQMVEQKQLVTVSSSNSMAANNNNGAHKSTEHSQEPISAATLSGNAGIASNPKKRDHSSVSSLNPPLDVPMSSSVQMDSLGSEDSLEAPAKRPKLFEPTNSLDSTVASTQHSYSDRSVNNTILPGSQELQRELELTYDTESQVFPDETSNISMNVDMPGNSSHSQTSAHDHSSQITSQHPHTSVHNFFPAETLLPDRTPTAPQLHPHELFQGELTSTFQCMECERESGRPEAFFDISLPIEKDRNLHWSLGEFFSKSILGGSDKYDCDTCRHLNEAYSYVRISKLPEVLTIHLKRFAWTAAQDHGSGYSLRSSALGGGSKLNFHIDCPEVLDMQLGWLSSSLQQRLLPSMSHSLESSPAAPMANAANGVQSSESADVPLSSSSQSIRRSVLLQAPNATVAQYELYAIIYHSGSSTTFGHYTSAIRVPTEVEGESLAPPSWVLFDDDHVRHLTHEQVMRSLSSEATGISTAYILWYRRMPTASSS